MNHSLSVICIYELNSTRKIISKHPLTYKTQMVEVDNLKDLYQNFKLLVKGD